MPLPLADTLLRLAEPPAVFDARWSDDILCEMSRTLVRRFARTPAKARYREAERRKVFPHALVHGYQPLISQMGNHPKDRHVLAAALACNADYLVTFNLRDFPATAGDLTAIVGPSAFLKTLWWLDRSAIDARLREQAGAIGFGVDELLDKLAQSVPAFVELLRSRD